MFKSAIDLPMTQGYHFLFPLQSPARAGGAFWNTPLLCSRCTVCLRAGLWRGACSGIVYDVEQFVVGLGNTGQEFEKTRHNIGIRVVRGWVAQALRDNSVHVTSWRTVGRFYERADIAVSEQSNVVCLFPLTMMNSSGEAVAAALWPSLWTRLVYKKSVIASHMIVVHDDLEIPFGRVAFVTGGSARGHKGVRSIHKMIGMANIARVKIGIGRPDEGVSVSDFVLQHFSSEEEATLREHVIPETCQILSEETGLGSGS